MCRVRIAERNPIFKCELQCEIPFSDVPLQDVPLLKSAHFPEIFAPGRFLALCPGGLFRLFLTSKVILYFRSFKTPCETGMIWPLSGLGASNWQIF